MARVFNFSAGPATLPQEVLEEAAGEMLDWRGAGMSVMEMSHRSAEFDLVAESAEADLRELLSIPSNYKILFMQGGAQAENAIVPLNMMRGESGADYVDTGAWSMKSIAEARRYGTVNVVASGAADGYTRIPRQDEWRPGADAAYLHICSNETIGGLEYHWTPQTGDVPLVADMSSHLLSRPLDVSKYGLIYAGAQKNIGMAGLTLVIVRDDLIGHAHPLCPSAFDYKIVADNDSMFNTPPTYAMYIAGLVFKWLKKMPAESGRPDLSPLAAIEARNIQKAALVYDCLDASHFYSTQVAQQDRSRMNVTFRLADEKLTASFVAEANARGLKGLKGHKLIGGIRASIYNAMPLEGVEALVATMREFEKTRA